MTGKAGQEPILLVGCGNMGGAMLAGWLAQGRPAGSIVVIDPAAARVPPGVVVKAEAEATMRPPRVLVLAVKPQMLAGVAPGLVPLIGPETILLSILAAVEIATLRSHFPLAGVIVRAVPNLPAAIGEGITALAGEWLDRDERDLVSGLCAPLGAVEWLAREPLCDAATSVSGCGPAFLFRFAEAVVRAGVAQGLDPDQARRLIATTMVGAGRMLLASPDSPAEMVRRVASPGGVTLAGLAVLDREEALFRLMGETLAAAAHRSAEMAVEAR